MTDVYYESVLRDCEMKKRLFYLGITIVLLLVEVSIALFVQDQFVRPYVGDMLVVILIYTFIRIFIPEKYPWLPAGIFLFAVMVEVLQWFHIVKFMGLGDNIFFSVLIGGVFDWKDILCYGIGCGVTVLAAYYRGDFR